MANSPENNPYIPGDPYSYDLKWMVKKINEWKDPLDSAERAKASEEAAAASAEAADLSAQDSADSAEASADSAASAKFYADTIADPVSGIVTEWLQDNITQPSTPPIDTSLNTAGAAADAKQAGYAVLPSFYATIEAGNTFDANGCRGNRIYKFYQASDALNIPAVTGIMIYLSGNRSDDAQATPLNYSMQIFVEQITTTQREYYIRSCFAGTWSAWEKRSERRFLKSLGHDVSLTDANNAAPNSVYAIQAADNVANVPEENGTLVTIAGSAFAPNNTASSNYTFQFYMAPRGVFYSRAYFNSLWSLWDNQNTGSDDGLFWARKVILAGDSITHGVGGTGFAQDGALIIDTGGRQWYRNPNGYCWANLFEDLLTNQYNSTVINNACTGTNSQFWADNVASLIPSDAATVILTVGTNDRDNTSPATARTAIINNIGTIQAYCQAHSIKLIVCSPVPASYANETDGDHPTHMWQINAFIKEACKRHHVTYKDLYSKCYEYYFNQGASIGSYADGLHPDDSMYYDMFYLYCWLLDVAPVVPPLTRP